MKRKYPEIDAILTYIHHHLYEPLELSRLAAYAGYSPYHFTRLFKAQMGLSPLYYVSSLRLQRAKELLLNTNLNIRDIGLEIGQQSLGTFTTRFTERVGVTPASFRSSMEDTGQAIRALQRLDSWDGNERLPHERAVRGQVRAVIPFDGLVLIGLFAKPIPEGMPLYGTLVPSSGKFCLSGVAPGVYYLMATSVSWGMAAADVLLTRTTLRTRAHDPIRITEACQTIERDVMLHLPSFDDPPILVSLPMLMNNFLSRQPMLQSR